MSNTCSPCRMNRRELGVVVFLLLFFNGNSDLLKALSIMARSYNWHDPMMKNQVRFWQYQSRSVKHFFMYYDSGKIS